MTIVMENKYIQLFTVVNPQHDGMFSLQAASRCVYGESLGIGQPLLVLLTRCPPQFLSNPWKGSNPAPDVPPAFLDHCVDCADFDVDEVADMGLDTNLSIFVFQPPRGLFAPGFSLLECPYSGQPYVGWARVCPTCLHDYTRINLLPPQPFDATTNIRVDVGGVGLSGFTSVTVGPVQVGMNHGMVVEALHVPEIVAVMASGPEGGGDRDGC